MNDRMDDLDLPVPPRRPLPPDVHNRLRARVHDGLQEPPRSLLNRSRPPLAVAASVAVLAAGAMIVAQSVGGSGDNVTTFSPPPSSSAAPQPPPLDPIVAAANLDRCFTAVQTAGKADRVPVRTAWEPIFAVPNRGRTVTAVRAAGRPLFCETTGTTVTVSDPNAEPGFVKGSQSAALMISKDGGIGGLVDPEWESMVLLSVSPAGASGGAPVMIKDGLFVDFTDFATGPGARFTVRQTIPGHPETPLPVGPGGVSTAPAPGEVVPGQTHAELDLPRPAEPLVAVTDRLERAPDRQSDQGAFLGECLARSDFAVVDPDAWEAVAIVGTAPYRAVLARFGNEAVSCTATGIQTNPNDLTEITIYHQLFPSYKQIAADGPIRFVTVLPTGPGHAEAALGLVGPGVTKVELRAPDQEPISAPVVNGAFAVRYELEAKEGPDRPMFIIALLDAAGTEVYYGELTG